MEGVLANICLIAALLADFIWVPKEQQMSLVVAGLLVAAIVNALLEVGQAIRSR